MLLGVHKAHRSRTFPPMSCAIVCTPRHSPACPWNACPVSAFCPPPRLTVGPPSIKCWFVVSFPGGQAFSFHLGGQNIFINLDSRCRPHHICRPFQVKKNETFEFKLPQVASWHEAFWTSRWQSCISGAAKYTFLTVMP